MSGALYEFLKLNYVHFPTELLICVIPFLVKKVRRENFIIRAVLSSIVYYGICGLWFQLIEHIRGDYLFPFVLLYMGYAVLMVLPLIVSFEMKPMEMVFVLVGGYAVQHMCFAGLRLVLYATRGHLIIEGWFGFFTQYLFFVIWAFLVYLILIRPNEDKDQFQSRDLRIAVYALVLAAAAVGLSVYYSYPADAPVNFYNAMICPAYSFLCCLLVLLLEYEVLRENRMQREQEMMNELLKMSNAHQKTSKEAIDIINMKCHDLKHQLRALSKLEDQEEQREYIQEVQQAVSIYDAIYHTGCEALDYILREKSLISEEHGIAFSCMVDGSLINFMHPADIYALFGNALDNAIEREEREQPEERSISFHMKKHQNMILIHLENRCSTPVQFVDGVPQTDKEDKDYHGFGIRSMQFIAQKYEGSLFTKMQDGKFMLDILLPDRATYPEN